MKSIEDNNSRILDWAAEKGIFSSSTAVKQLEKTAEELVETAVAAGKMELLVRVSQYLPEAVLKNLHTEILNDIKDGYGDIHVTCVNGIYLSGLTQNECVEHSVNEITGRKGEMVNGKFVKEDI